METYNATQTISTSDPLLTRQEIERELQHTVATLLCISKPFCAAPHIDWSAVDHRDDDATARRYDGIDNPLPRGIAAPPAAASSTPHSTGTGSRFPVHFFYRAYAVVYFTCVLVAFYNHHFRTITSHAALTEKTIYAAHYATYFLQYFLIVVGTQRQHRQYPRIVRHLAAIDVRLMRLHGAIKERGAPMPSDKFQTWTHLFKEEHGRMRRCIAAVLVVLFAVMGSTLCIDVIVYKALTVSMWLRSIVVYLFSHATDYLILLQMIVVLRMLRTRYATVNLLLKRTLSAIVFSSSSISGFPKDKQRTDTITANARLALLRNLRRLHCDLNALHAKLTRSFGLLLVFLVVNTVLDLTVEMYTIYRFTVHFADWWMAAYTGLWMCMYCVKVLAVLWFSELVEREREMYALTVGETRRSSDLGDRGLNEQLFKIQMQALHDRDPQMACGIAPLNLSLFTTILGSLTGLLVMLIQFESSVITVPPSI